MQKVTFEWGNDRVLIMTVPAGESNGYLGTFIGQNVGVVQLELGTVPLAPIPGEKMNGDWKAINLTKSQARAVGSALIGAAADL